MGEFRLSVVDHSYVLGNSPDVSDPPFGEPTRFNGSERISLVVYLDITLFSSSLLLTYFSARFRLIFVFHSSKHFLILVSGFELEYRKKEAVRCTYSTVKGRLRHGKFLTVAR